MLHSFWIRTIVFAITPVYTTIYQNRTGRQHPSGGRSTIELLRVGALYWNRTNILPSRLSAKSSSESNRNKLSGYFATKLTMHFCHKTDFNRKCLYPFYKKSVSQSLDSTFLIYLSVLSCHITFN